MQDLNDLYYFAMVVEHGGFAAAERALGIPKSRLSRRISQLENDLGVRLLQRSTRRFAVTDVGMSVYRHAQTMLAEAQAAGDVRGDMDPRMLAFFFDNLLMMLQDSYSSDYYRERLRRYCGEEAAEDEDFVASQLIRFLECAFTFESGDIRHKNRGEDER